MEAKWIIQGKEQETHPSLQQDSAQVKPITPLQFKKPA